MHVAPIGLLGASTHRGTNDFHCLSNPTGLCWKQADIATS